ncbi:hypothetical protein [Maritimibacter sp. UBA3975]|uniref:hypothetical protein n=1 Tax=Maritimibacter sp. UBA3975 TaxID=1946833 RepID=UPI000C0B19BD|nr:hypothetical protein [Maritimibacter sp. UBA3975]MAM63856.1 hypothetical protein [Maritimibacter sp.]|tara:strand:- start:75876 stop:76232 length:357 start_codon:yes stop_codon:yes gene_type:complete
MSSNQLKPPANAQRISRRADLSPNRQGVWIQIENEGSEPTKALLSKSKRQVVDTLLRGPVYAASPVRISDIVHILKRDVGLDIETKMYPGDPDNGSMSYGVYFLRSKVTLLDKREVAA